MSHPAFCLQRHSGDLLNRTDQDKCFPQLSGGVEPSDLYQFHRPQVALWIELDERHLPEQCRCG